jgi:hypothetical protein
MSKRYLKSSWCSDEREWFQKQSEGRAGDVGRLFVIRAQETDVNLWPEFLRDERGHGIPGFVFYDPDDGTPLSFELREPNDDYFKALGRLQTRLVKGLREMRDREAKHLRDQVTAAILPAPAGPRLIYLHAPPDSESERLILTLRSSPTASCRLPLRLAKEPALRIGSERPERSAWRRLSDVKRWHYYGLRAESALSGIFWI